jgi:hypothetical protein
MLSDSIQLISMVLSLSFSSAQMRVSPSLFWNRQHKIICMPPSISFQNNMDFNNHAVISVDSFSILNSAVDIITLGRSHLMRVNQATQGTHFFAIDMPPPPSLSANPRRKLPKPNDIALIADDDTAMYVAGGSLSCVRCGVNCGAGGN